MKKILFSLIAILTLFSSCSSDDEIINNRVDNTDATRYTVNLNVKSAGFEIDKTPMKSLTTRNSYLQIIVYKKSGEFYSNSILLNDSISKIISNEEKVPFSLELPKGEYHISFIHNLLSVSLGSTITEVPDRVRLEPQNFYTDIEYATGIKGSYTDAPSANRGNYYQTIDLSVGETTQNEDIPVVLDPMWSTMNVTINDIEIPTGCNFVRIGLNYAYCKYNISNKLAISNLGNQYTSLISVSPSTIGSIGNSFDLSKSSDNVSDLKLIIEWYKYPYTGDESLILKKEIEFSTEIKNGLKYKATGKLNNLEIRGGNLNITYAPFNEDKPVDLPF